MATRSSVRRLGQRLSNVSMGTRRSSTNILGLLADVSHRANISTQSGPHKTPFYEVPKWMVKILVPVSIIIYAFLRLSAPDKIPRRTPLGAIKPKSVCTEVHASDLDNWIKAHPDEVEDEHTIGWNKMYTNFVDHAWKSGEADREQAEYARQLAAYARKEENINRSTKEKGRMSTLSANKNIGHQPMPTEELEDEVNWSFSDHMAWRVAQIKKRLSYATKGMAFGDK